MEPVSESISGFVMASDIASRLPTRKCNPRLRHSAGIVGEAVLACVIAMYACRVKQRRHFVQRRLDVAEQRGRLIGIARLGTGLGRARHRHGYEQSGQC